MWYNGSEREIARTDYFGEEETIMVGKRKNFSLLFAVLVCFVLFSLLFVFLSVPTSDSATSANVSNVYYISSQEDFASFVNDLTGNVNTFSGKIFLLCDVDLQKTPFSLAYFGGVLNGFGHKISNASRSLFNQINAGGVVQNVYFDDMDLKGCLFGTNNGTLRGLTFSGQTKIAGTTSVNMVPGAVVRNNAGTIEHCTSSVSFVRSDNYGDNVLAGFAVTNTGTISDCVMAGSFTLDFDLSPSRVFTYRVGGIALDNEKMVNEVTTKGTITGCAVAADFIYLNDTVAAQPKKLNANSRMAAIAFGGTVVDSYAYYFGGEYSYERESVTYTATPILADGTLTNVYGNRSYTNDGVVYSHAITGSAPDVTGVLSGQGTVGDPFLLKTDGDVLRLKVTDLAAAYRYQNDFYLDPSLYGTHPETVTGFSSYAASAAWTDGGYYATGDFGFGETETAVVADVLAGTGAATDPYLVSDSGDLKALDGLTGYAVLTKDILLNVAGDGADYRLDLTSIDLTLMGSHRRIVGLNGEPLCETLTGTISGLIVAGRGGYFADNNEGTIVDATTFCTDSSAGIAVRNESGGVISDCTFVGTSNYALTSQNDGTVTRCTLSGTAVKSFVATSVGSYTDCYVLHLDGAAPFTGVDRTIVNDSTTAVIVGGVKRNVASLSSVNLISYGFDFETGAFAYPVGEDVPEFRAYGGEYKENYSDGFNGFALSGISTTYNGTMTINQANATLVSSYLYEDPATDFDWTYDGEPLVGDFGEVGDYVVDITYYGDADYLAQIFHDEIAIQKADAPLGLSIAFAAGDFDNESFDYSGQTMAARETAADPSAKFLYPVPTNTTELENYGFLSGNLSYQLTDGIAVSSGRNAGLYTQTVRITAKNYNDLTRTRTLTVQRIPLTVHLGDLTIGYLATPDYSSVATELTGLVPSDEGKTLAQLDGYNAVFGNDYSVGDGVGEYDITLTLTLTNYTPTVYKGTLTVDPIDLPADGIDFFGATELTHGSTTATYIGSAIALAATVPAGVTAVYTNNENVNVGDYVVWATFSKENYNDLILGVDLSITQATLTITLPSRETDYGSGWEVTGIPEVTGFCKEEDEALISLIGFVYSIQKDEFVSTDPTDVLDVGTYELRAEITGTLLNYDFSVTPGAYVVNKAYLTALCPANLYPDVTKEYDGEAVDPTMDAFVNAGYPVSLGYAVEKNGSAYNGTIDNAGTYVVTVTATPYGILTDNYRVTVYTKTIRIDKAALTVAFESDEYSYPYDGSDKGIFSLYTVVGTIDRSRLTFECKEGLLNSSAIHAGDYTIRVSFAGTENEELCSAQASLTVTPKQVSLDFDTNYSYTGNAIVPVFHSAIGLLGSDTIGEGDLLYTYYSASQVAPLTAVINASSNAYTFAVAFNGKPDYEPSETRYTMKVNKMAVEVTIGEVEYIYGTRGQIYQNGVYYDLRDRGFLRKSLQVTPSILVDVPVSLGTNESGVYTLTNANLTDTTNIDFSLKSGERNIVTISRRTLTVTRTYDGTEISSPYSLTYLGRSLTSRFGYTLSNFATGDDATGLTVEVNVSGSDSDIYHVGTYTIGLILRDSVNYLLGSTSLVVEVKKTALDIQVGDVTVEQGAPFVVPQLTLAGKVGEDETKSYSELKGASVTFRHTYTTEARVNSRIVVTVDAKFDDYTSSVSRTGTLSVVANPYPDYVLTDQSYVYDGTHRTVVLEDVDPAISVSYSNNVHTDAGRYFVSATLTYPSGRVKVTTCYLTIVKANPTLQTEPIEVVYAKDKVLSSDLIKGTAVVAGREVEGTFAFTEEHLLVEGEQAYECRFTPTDDKNVNAYNTTVSVKCEAVDMSVFSFDPLDNFSFVEVTEGVCRASITGTVDMRVRSSLEGLKLYLNGYVVNYIRLSKTDRMNVAVKLGENEALAFLLEVTLQEESAPVVFNDEVMDFGDAKRKGDVLTVPSGGTRISLSESMSENYALYVDGLLVKEYILNGNEGQVAVVVRSKDEGKVVFSRIYTVDVPSSVEEERAVNTGMWIGIGCGAAGVAVAIAIVLILWKKKHG